MMKKLLAIVLSLVMLTAASAALAENKTVGILQSAEHGSLDNCREGFLQGLAEAGYVEGENLTIKYYNAQADGGTDAQIAQSLVAYSVDLICAIATPSAQAAFNAVLSAKADIPVIYTAVSAPIEAGLANDDGTPVGLVTGTSDLLPIRNQLAMIRELMPDAKTVGLLYTSSETNSEVQAALYEEMAGEFGFEIVSATVTAGAEVSQAVQALLPQVDCLSMLTDNTVASYLAVVLNAAEQAGKPSRWRWAARALRVWIMWRWAGRRAKWPRACSTVKALRASPLKPSATAPCISIPTCCPVWGWKFPPRWQSAVTPTWLSNFKGRQHAWASFKTRWSRD